jgi:hypothetical protein
MSTVDRRVWHDDHFELSITTDECSGLLEIISRNPTIIRARLEIYRQAKNALALPLGPACKIFTTDLKLERLDASAVSVGRFWLPQHLVRHFREYYYRVTFHASH